MKYVVQDSENKKMIMEVVSSIPQLPDGFQVLGLADELPEAVVEIEAASQIEQVKTAARLFLVESDWKVLRHRDQIDAGTPTSLTSEEFSQLLVSRQAARDII